MPKATAAKKPAPKSSSSTASRPTSSKAAQAAAHQGRPAPVEETRRPVPAEPRAQVPATRAAAPPPAAANLPTFMRNDYDVGKENISQQDMEIPRLKLMQGLSPELQEYDGLKAGHFFHPAAEHIFDGPFRAVPIFFDVQFILWNPRQAGGGIIARTLDGVHWVPSEGTREVTLDKKDGGAKVTWRWKGTVQQSGLANWGTMNPADPNSPPAATQIYNYLLGFPDEPDLPPAVISFQRSSIKMGRRFNTKLKTVRAPLFGTMWEFSSKQDTNANGEDFFNIDVKSAGLVEDEALYNYYRDFHESIKGKGLTLKDIEGLQDEGAPGTGGDEPEGSPRY